MFRYQETKLKQKIIELDLPIDKSDFFVKKAEIKLKKILAKMLISFLLEEIIHPLD